MNMHKNIYLLFLVVSFSLLFLNCNEDFNREDWRLNTDGNIPAIGNTTNSFAFAVAANNYSFSEKYLVDFNSNSLSLGLTITNYRNGNGRLELINSKDSVYYSVSLNSNIAYGSKDITLQIPKRIGVTLSNFTGQLSIGIAGK